MQKLCISPPYRGANFIGRTFRQKIIEKSLEEYKKKECITVSSPEKIRKALLKD
jgi:hypothetical protein